MPVYRIGTGRGETVHAFAGELDAWMVATGRTRDLDDQPDEAEPENGDRAVEVLPVPGNGDGPGADEQVAQVAQPADVPARKAGGRHAATGVALSALVGLAAAFLWWKLPFREAVPVRSTAAPAVAKPLGPPASASADVDTLRVFDPDGREIFKHQFAFTLSSPESYKSPAPSQETVLFQDIDGDGSREVIVNVTPTQRDLPGEVWTFRADSTQPFKLQLDRTVRFGTKMYGPPWQPLALFSGAGGSPRRFWVAWVDRASGEFPCLLQSISAEGKVLSEYWNAGYITTVEEWTRNGKRLVLVGAADNDLKGANLAVFDADRVQGASPAQTPEKTCRGCPPGVPQVFLVFPRLESLEMTGGCPYARLVSPQADGSLTVWVFQGTPDFPGAVSRYTLDRGFRPISSWIADEYRAAHARLEKEKRLDHAFGDRDRAQTWPVHIYEGGRWARVTGASER